MTLREAICHAIEVLRTAHDDDQARTAAKVLERKAERLRARTEQPAVWEHRCLCGERRTKRAMLCPDCHTAVPMALMVAFLMGKPSASRKARREIAGICRARVGELERRAA